MRVLKKLALIIFLCAFLFAFLFLNNTDVAFAQTIKIRIGSTNPPLGLDAKTVELFVMLAKNKLGDKVDFEIFGGGTLGGYKEMLEMLKVNSLECLYQSLGVTEFWTPIGGLEGVPFLYSDLEAFDRFWSSSTAEDYLQAVADSSGFYMIGPHWRGFRIMTVKKPVRTPDDLKKVKLRVPPSPTFIAAWKAMGANVAPMSFSEVFSALQQGVIDGQENPLAHSYDSGFGEICKYVVLTNHMAETMGWIWNIDYFKKLPKEIKDGLREAAIEAGKWHEMSVLLSDEEYLEKYKKLGVEIIVPDHEAFRKKALDVKINKDLQVWVDKARKILEQ